MLICEYFKIMIKIFCKIMKTYCIVVYDFRLCLQLFKNMKNVASIFLRQAQRCCGCPPFFRSNPGQRVSFSMLPATGGNGEKSCLPSRFSGLPAQRSHSVALQGGASPRLPRLTN